MRAHGVLGDEEPLRDLLRAEVLVEEEEDLHLAGREPCRDRVGNAAAEAAALAHPLEEPAGDGARECRLAASDTSQERGDPLAGMEVTASGFRDLSARCAQLAPRVTAVLEGGYNLETLPGLVEAALEGFSSQK